MKMYLSGTGVENYFSRCHLYCWWLRVCDRETTPPDWQADGRSSAEAGLQKREPAFSSWCEMIHGETPKRSATTSMESASPPPPRKAPATAERGARNSAAKARPAFWIGVLPRAIKFPIRAYRNYFRPPTMSQLTAVPALIARHTLRPRISS